MLITRTLSTAEMHTAAESFRTITSGLPKLPGHFIDMRRQWLLTHIDGIRQALMFGPHAHADLYGSCLTPPVSPSANFGGIFLSGEGYSDHCKHGAIAPVSGNSSAIILEVAGTAYLAGFSHWTLNTRDTLNNVFPMY